MRKPKPITPPPENEPQLERLQAKLRDEELEAISAAAEKEGFGDLSSWARASLAVADTSSIPIEVPQFGRGKKRTEYLTVRVGESERTRWDECAGQFDLPVADVLRRVLLTRAAYILEQG